MQIRYYRKKLYGKENYYILDCARELLCLMGPKRLDKNCINALERMGHKMIELTEEEAKKVLCSGYITYAEGLK